MSKYCADCGSKLSKGICSNCDEELYIETYQYEYMVGKTDEWDDRVIEQKMRRKQRLVDVDEF